MNKYKGFTNEELVILAQEGNEEAREQLIKQNENFIHMIAHRQWKPSDPTMTYEDIYSEGVVGFLEAVNRFDASKGFKLTTYAGTYISGRIAIAYSVSSEGRCFRIGGNKKRLYGKIVNKKIELQQELLRTPTNQELADAMDMDIGELGMLINLHESHSSIFETVVENARSQSDDKLLVHYIESNEPTENQIAIKLTITDLIAKLSEREQKIIKLYYFEGYRQKEIAEMMGWKQSNTNVYIKNILRKLREMLEEE